MIGLEPSFPVVKKYGWIKLLGRTNRDLAVGRTLVAKCRKVHSLIGALLKIVMFGSLGWEGTTETKSFSVDSAVVGFFTL